MHQYDAIQLYDLGFGPRLVPVTHPDCEIAPTSRIRAKDKGKAPGMLTPSGWAGVDVNNVKFRCPDYATAKLWHEGWNANVGLVAGDGFVIIDNDQGREFSQILQRLLTNPLRRYVLDPKHERDGFLVRVLDFIGEGAEVANREMLFRKGTLAAKLSILARGKQAVIAGVHPGTRSPYAWDRELEGPDQVPTLSERQFEIVLDKFVTQVADLGWVRDRPNGPVSAPVSATTVVSAVSPHPITPSLGHNHPPSDILLEAQSLLAEIPNRDLGPNDVSSSVDDWLDDYANWVSVAYALIAFLGPQAHSPEARDLWITWSDGRSQTAQTSESVWRSALAQSPRFGGAGLIKLVRSLVRQTPDFPDIDPDDPMFAPDPDEAPKSGSSTPIWDQLRARWAFSMRHGFIDMRTGRVYSKQAFNDGCTQLADALRRELNIPKKARLTVAGMFLRQPDYVGVFDITYAPGDPRFVPSIDPALPSFNRWKDSVSLGVLVHEAQIQKWIDHLVFVLGSRAECDRFLRWCAFVVQNPRLKPNWHFLVISDAGLGKDTMTAPMKIAVGSGNYIDILSYALSNEFNPWIEHKLIIVGEIAQTRTGINSPTEVNNRLKPLLAAPPSNLTVNRKNQQQYEIPNRCAVILFSNSQNPLHLERFSRRVHVINRLGALVRGANYYEDMHRWLEAGGADLCAAYLRAYPLSEAEKREFSAAAPDTTDKTELESQNLHPQQAALEELIDDARAGIKDGTPWNLVANTDELAAMIKAKGVLHPSPQNIRTWLMDMERRGTGVRRCRIDPRKPSECAVVGNNQHSGRLWLLADTTADGRLWGSLTATEIIALWKNLPPPKSASVTRLPRASFPDDQEEPV